MIYNSSSDASTTYTGYKPLFHNRTSANSGSTAAMKSPAKIPLFSNIMKQSSYLVLVLENVTNLLQISTRIEDVKTCVFSNLGNIYNNFRKLQKNIKNPKKYRAKDIANQVIDLKFILYKLGGLLGIKQNVSLN